ncbi:MAG: photosynthetic complex assembly protein PuhC [Roseomonas sp.]
MNASAIKPQRNYIGYGLGLCLGLVLAFVVLSADRSLKPSISRAEVLFARNILFSDRVDGGISIRDASTGQLIGEIAPGEGGFIRGALRGFTRELRLQKPGSESPLRLAALEGGAIILEDPASGRWTDLRAFGATNVQSFSEFLFIKNEDGQ